MNPRRIEAQADLIKALPEPSILVSSEGLICAANPAFLRILGRPTESVLAQELTTLVTESPEKLRPYLQSCARSRQPVPGKLTFAASPQGGITYRCDGAVVEPWSHTTPALILLRLRLEESAASRFILLNNSLEELHREIRERRQVEAHLRLLAEVSTTLADTLEHHTLLQKLSEQIVGHFADWCMVYLREPDGTITRVATAHIDPAKQAWARRLTERSPSYAVPPPFVRVIESGQSFFLPEYDETCLLDGIDGIDATDQLTIIRRIDPKSVIAVPLHARSQNLGALALVWSENNNCYSHHDLEFAQELARRIALVVENARLYQATRAAEAQLREFNQTLEALVAERTFELKRSNEELDQFAYVASHDLRAPLRAITHLTNWLEDDGGDALPSVAHSHIHKMRQRLARMERLLDDLLTYARAGRQNHAPEEVNIAALLHSLFELLSPPPTFRITLADSLPILHAERVPLETVFRNLLNNAIKHHDNPDNGQIWVSSRHNGSRIEFAVSDNGPGIAPQFHTRIFTIFQSLKPRDQVEGSGIGLAVVKKMVENRGGSVQVESEVGAGATFRFTWPVSA